MKSTTPHRRAERDRRAMVCRWARAGTEALVVAALSLSAVTCLAAENPSSVFGAGQAPASERCSAGEAQQNHRFDLVIVQPKGWGRKGFRFQISLLSPANGLESALDLNAGENGLLVTARDVDGVGNDLDLIIKDAKSYTPLGLWINDHQGGFIKVDSRLYAQSLWADGPFLLALGLPDALQRAIISLPQPCIDPLLQLRFGAFRMSQGPAESSHADRLPYFASDSETTRGPPFSTLT